MTRTAPAVALLALLAACQAAPIAPVPDPLPEALPWSTSEEVERGAFLGLELRENDSGSLDELAFEPGVRVIELAAGSPAAEAGLQLGDVVLRYDGAELFAPEDVEALLRGGREGDEVGLQVLRDDTVFDVRVVLRSTAAGAAAEARPLYRVDVSRTRAAWASGPRGVVLVSAAEDGPTARAGLPLGSVVVAVDGASVASDRGLIRRLARYEPGTEVVLTLLDDENRTSEREVRLFLPKEVITRSVFPILWGYNADADGENKSLVLIDLYFISLFRYTRTGTEKEWRILRFIQFSSDVGELGE